MESDCRKGETMTGKSAKADFKGFVSKAKEANKSQEEMPNSVQSSSYRYFQVRVTREDSNRLKTVISSKDLSVQSVLIEALNLWMNEYGHPPLSNPGTAREK